MRLLSRDESLSLAVSLTERLLAEFQVDKLASLHEPDLGSKEEEYTRSCIQSGFVSSVGEFVNRFETELSARYESRSVVATSSGTSALHLALIGAGVRPGDEVIMPAATFVATANAASHCGAVPHFVDIDESTLSLSPTLLGDRLRSIGVARDGSLVNRASGRRIGAVIVVDLFGHPSPVEGLLRVLEEFNVPLVEDAAEAVGSFFDGRPVGVLAPIATLSFNGNKIVTTGGGGAVVLADAEVGKLLKHLSTTAKQPHRWEYFHDMVGYNYRLPNINAALGCAQLERLNDFLAAKRGLFARYSRVLSGLAGVRLLEEPPNSRSNYWLQTLIFNDEPDLSVVLEHLTSRGIGARPLWRPLHQLPMYSSNPRGELTVTESLARRVVNLPSGVGVASR